MDKKKEKSDPVGALFGYVIFIVLLLVFLDFLGVHLLIGSFVFIAAYIAGISLIPSAGFVKKIIAFMFAIGFYTTYFTYWMDVSDLISFQSLLREDQRSMSYSAYFISLLNPVEYYNSLPQITTISIFIGTILIVFAPSETPGERIINSLRNKDKPHKLKHIKKMNDIPADIDFGSFLGIDNKNNKVGLDDDKANAHTLVLGTTGSGKTVSVLNIVESAINRNLPVIFIDGKGDEELGRSVIEFAKSKGRKTYFFTKRNKDTRYNPLATGTYTSKKDRIMGLREWTEPYYKRLSEEYLQNIFKILDMCGMNDLDLEEAVEYMDVGRLSGLVRKTELEESQKNKISKLIKDIQMKAKEADGAVSELRLFVNSDLGELFSTRGQKANNVLSLSRAIEENAIVYFALPTLEGKEASSMLGKLVINDLKAVISERMSIKGYKKKFYTVFDEFSVFAGEQVLNIINMGRSAGVCGVISTQTTADLSGAVQNSGESFISQVISNCNNFIIHRLNDPKAAEELASLIGTEDKIEITGKIIADKFGDEGTMKATKAFKVHPDQIKELPLGRAIFLSKSPYRIRKIAVRHSEIDRT